MMAEGSKQMTLEQGMEGEAGGQGKGPPRPWEQPRPSPAVGVGGAGRRPARLGQREVMRD